MRLPNPGEKLPPNEQLKRFKLLIETTYLPLKDIYRTLGETQASGTTLYKANYSAYYRKERTADLIRKHSTGRPSTQKRAGGRGLGELSTFTESYLDSKF